MVASEELPNVNHSDEDIYEYAARKNIRGLPIFYVQLAGSIDVDGINCARIDFLSEGHLITRMKKQ